MPSKALTLEMREQDAADPETAIKAYLNKIDRSLERNKKTQARIDKLKGETREILAKLKAQMR